MKETMTIWKFYWRSTKTITRAYFNVIVNYVGYVYGTAVAGKSHYKQIAMAIAKHYEKKI